MRVVLAICREYGQGPAWWAAQDNDDQALMLADYERRVEDQNRASKRRKGKR